MKKLAGLMLLLCTGLFLFSGCGDEKTKTDKTTVKEKTTVKTGDKTTVKEKTTETP